MDKKGFTLIELIIVVAIIGILAGIAIPAYIGSQKRAARSEAYNTLMSLQLLETSFYTENSRYTKSLGVCAPDNPGNPAVIRSGGGDATNALPGFNPGTGLSYSYCIESNVDVTGAAQTPCYRARAFGNSVSRVSGDVFAVDCNNNKTF